MWIHEVNLKDWWNTMNGNNEGKIKRVRCNECNQNFEIKLEYVGREVVDNARQIGPEYEHRWEWMGNCENLECSNEIEASYSDYEYPEGFYNESDDIILGGEYVD